MQVKCQNEKKAGIYPALYKQQKPPFIGG